MKWSGAESCVWTKKSWSGAKFDAWSGALTNTPFAFVLIHGLNFRPKFPFVSPSTNV